VLHQDCKKGIQKQKIPIPFLRMRMLFSPKHIASQSFKDNHFVKLNLLLLNNISIQVYGILSQENYRISSISFVSYEGKNVT
jgi:hypothetical protein